MDEVLRRAIRDPAHRTFTRAENVECALLPILRDRVLAFVLRTLVSDEANPRLPKSAVGFAQPHYSAFTYAAAFCAKRLRKEQPRSNSPSVLLCGTRELFQKLMVRPRLESSSTRGRLFKESVRDLKRVRALFSRPVRLDIL